jgi:hypothetical protein
MEADTLGKLIEAIQQRSYYPLAAYLLTILIAVWARWQPRLFEPKGGKGALIPDRLQWLPAVLLAGAGAFVGAFASGLSWQLAIGVTAYTMAVGGPMAVGVHRIAKETSGHKGAPASGSPSAGGIAAGLVLFLAVAGWSAPACGATQKSERPPCQDTTLAAIVAACIGEITAACKAEGADYESCKARPALQAACDQRVDEWERCAP